MLRDDSFYRAKLALETRYGSLTPQAELEQPLHPEMREEKRRKLLPYEGAFRNLRNRELRAKARLAKLGYYEGKATSVASFGLSEYATSAMRDIALCKQVSHDDGERKLCPIYELQPEGQVRATGTGDLNMEAYEAADTQDQSADVPNHMGLSPNVRRQGDARPTTKLGSQRQDHHDAQATRDPKKKSQRIGGPETDRFKT